MNRRDDRRPIRREDRVPAAAGRPTRPVERPGRGGPGDASRPRPARPLAVGRERPWPRVSWWYSGLVVLPLLIVAALLATPAAEGETRLAWRFADAAGPVSGVRVVAGAVVATADADGVVALPRSAVGSAPVAIEREGYYPILATVPAGIASIETTLVASSVSGTVTDGRTGAPIGGATVGVVGAATTVTTESDGRYRLDGLSPGAAIGFAADGYGAVELPVDQRTTVDGALMSQRVTGVVTDGAGSPVSDAFIQVGDVSAASQSDGTFTVEGVADATEVRISASGFGDVLLPIADDRVVAAELERIVIRASYLNQAGLQDDDAIDAMIDLIGATELNAVVLDIKQDTIHFDSAVRFFTEVPGMVAPIYDPGEIVARFHDAGIYVIARQVVFQDPLVAAHYPELSVRNEDTGEPWLDPNGVSWVNAFHEELWDANIALALEVVGLGFDEIQYDYVRFTSDGDLTTADFGPDYSQAAREGAITGFVKRSYEAIQPTGAKLALDVFGIIALYDDDQGIGQRLSALAPYADYLCLMIYPSHFSEGNIRSAPGHPNDYPAETITESLERAAEIVPEHVDKFRPWLQDFTQPLEGFSAYGPDEVRAQIDAAEAFGVSGWLLWNPNNEPTVEALEPE